MSGPKSETRKVYGIMGVYHETIIEDDDREVAGRG